VPHTDLAVETTGLGRRFGRHWALAHLDLAVNPGQVVLVAGANGSGKTTLLRILAGLNRPSQGRVQVFGLDPRKERLTCRGLVSLVSHHAYLYDRLRALETLRLWARLLGQPSEDDYLLSLLESVGLAHRRDFSVGGFSAGMRKRMALLRTRLEDSRLVLLDEPFSALDVSGQRLVEDWIRDYRERGVTVLIASHALERAAALCDLAVLLEQGQKVWQGRAENVFDQIEGARP
jgi:heme exporter protein A